MISGHERMLYVVNVGSHNLSNTSSFQKVCSQIIILKYLVAVCLNNNDHTNKQGNQVATLLGPEKEREINWYLQPGHKEKLIRQLTPIIHKISEIVLRCAISVCNAGRGRNIKLLSDYVKKVVACLLFGGSRKTLPDGVRLRGDINDLLLGDQKTGWIKN
ncbi:unnamed protein product [Lactuca saligna]|uniref:MCM C-terminal AAA(+) ATPase domain-containing protein n=1 Tax=Lactuca saligna TaxID=75948 RepID=A0AA36EN90_LACSI|nr:unnamed protein product [Lactuca saligna]